MRSPQYLVAVQLLNRGPRGRQRESLYRALDYSPKEIDAAIESLEREGVLTVSGRTVRASAATACLARLELIAL